MYFFIPFFRHKMGPCNLKLNFFDNFSSRNGPGQCLRLKIKYIITTITYLYYLISNILSKYLFLKEVIKDGTGCGD